MLLDQCQRVVFCSNSAVDLFGLSSNEILDRPVKEVLLTSVSLLDSPQAIDTLLSAIDSASSCSQDYETTLIRPDRAILKVSVFRQAIMQGDIATAILVRDVTEASEAERRRDDFIIVLSHEILDPVINIVGWSDFLLNQSTTNSIRRNALRAILNSGRSIERVARDLVEVVRIKLGYIHINQEPLNLRNVFTATVAEFSRNSDKHEFVVNLEEDLPCVICDRFKLQQVLENLLSNAVKYSPSGGQITVSTCYEPSLSRVVISVADQGIGIATEDWEQIFVPFQRINSPESEQIIGIGLGLYAVRRLVELMGGEVWLDSTVGKGTTFFFSLPSAG